jgi:hypothetical protein
MPTDSNGVTAIEFRLNPNDFVSDLNLWALTGVFKAVMRYVFKAVDIVVSIVFLALCAKAFCIHFYRDIKRQPHARKLLTSQPQDETSIAELPARVGS